MITSKTRGRATPRPTRSAYTTFHQLVQYIPHGLIDKIANEEGADIRKFSATSHFMALLFGQLTSAPSLNDICDALRLHEPELKRIRGATAPKRNTFSNANRRRDPIIAERMYWALFDHLRTLAPGFTQCKKHSGFLHRVKRDIFAIDSTTLQLTLNSIDWAKHRRKKAAAKTHMRLNIGNMLPVYVVIEEASHHDVTRAEALCAGLEAGNVLLADRAYLDYGLLNSLSKREVIFVMREKKNLRFKVISERKHENPNIVSDQTVVPEDEKTAEKYTGTLRRVTAIVQVNRQDCEMTFITNHLTWSPWTIAELYRARWAIELFFKEIKQTLQLSDFVGYNENAVKWQVWVALIAHLLLRFMKHISKWGLSFSRLCGITRAAIWMKNNFIEILNLYGTADGPKRPTVVGEQLYFQGFHHFSSDPMG